jgi:putative redox protein
MDEPASSNGKDLGPDAYSTLLASLSGWTLSTLRMYIDRKAWIIPEINSALNVTQDTEGEFTTILSRTISFSTDITSEQKERLLLIAGKCPITKILKGKITINTQL